MVQNLRDIRKSRKITMKELSKIIGVSEAAVSQYETGKRDPDLKTLIAISNYFDVTTDYLLGLSAPAPALSQEYTADETALLAQYQHLNQEGREKASDYLIDLVSSGRYKKDSQFLMASKEA